MLSKRFTNDFGRKARTECESRLPLSLSNCAGGIDHESHRIERQDAFRLEGMHSGSRAPALGVANVGIAMGGGIDMTLKIADAAELHGGHLYRDYGRPVEADDGQHPTEHRHCACPKAVFLVTSIARLTGL